MRVRLSVLSVVMGGVGCVLAVAGAAVAQGGGEAPFEVPPDFRATVYAEDDLATDIHTMTLDARGRVVVAGTGYVKILHDDDGDGRADRATLYSDVPSRGIQGMAFDGDRLIITGDNGVRVLRDTTGDDRADAEPEQWATLRHPEHGTNGIVKGPDGWFYIITGNDAAVTAEHATLPTSPITQPDQGALVRFRNDGSESEVVADGLRNPYDLDFNSLGHVFTYDADGERDYHLPWYSGSRIFDLAQGEHHGWVLGGWQRSWNRPEYFFDNVERLYDVGRGSPTGVTAYRHRQFPQRYRDGLFAVCWTYGTVYFFPLEPEGATYRTEMETFVRPSGSAGFAPVAIEVGPEGEMYVAIGGRGTRGGVYRIEYVGEDGGDEPRVPADVEGGPLEQVLRADQPLTAWSRAEWAPLAQGLGREAFVEAAVDRERSQRQRIRAIEVLVEMFGGLGVEAARQAMDDQAPFVTARVAWALSRREVDDAGAELLADLTHREHPHVQRAAWEALATLAELPDASVTEPAWLAAADSDDRRIRAAAARAAGRAGHGQFTELRDRDEFDTPGRLLFANHVEGVDAGEAYLDRIHHAWRGADDPQLRLMAVRMWQRAMGDILADADSGNIDLGYTARAPDRLPDRRRDQIVSALSDAFPTDHVALDREIARTLAMLRAADDSDLLHAITTRWMNESYPRDDVHYLIALAHLGGERPAAVTERTADALATLHAKYRRHNLEPADNFPRHVQALLDRLLERDATLAEALVEADDFGSPDHVLFFERLDGAHERDAMRRLLARATAAGVEDADAWPVELIRATAVLEADEVLPVLRELWDAQEGRRDAIASVLARRGDASDRGRLVTALGSANAAVVAEVAGTLPTLADEPAVDDLVAALRAFARHRQHEGAAESLAALLEQWTGQSLEGDYEAWAAWFADRHPEQAGRITLADGRNLEQWLERLDGVDWAGGDAGQGEAVFQQRLCAACHQQSHRLGPDLRGVARRFGREDLFVKIIEPDSAISPLYEAIAITTHDGEQYVGVPVYQSPQATLLEVNVNATVRITGDEIARIEPAQRSLMPPNLLEGLTDEQLADLYAYLQQLE